MAVSYTHLDVYKRQSYHLVDYSGAPDAARVIILMGSGAAARCV